ncbi:MAG: AraC family transcriptional regulator [Clostridia bacterium]|nr:AraC family transcriptional regulator [Clostridia bacterium]
MSNTDKNSLLKVFRTRLGIKNSTLSTHHHTAFEVTIILSGGGVYVTKDANYTFEKNDIFFFSTDEYHQVKQLNADSEFINLHFEPRLIWSDNFGISSAELTKVFLHKKENATNKISHNSDTATIIRELLFKMEQETIKQNSGYEIMLRSYLVNVLVEIMRSQEHRLDSSVIPQSSHTLRYIEKALAYIDSHFNCDLSLDMLANAAHMSKTYFCSQFKALNGISPWDYITIKRIEQAIFYIENTNMTRLEIALKCGYNNTSNFYYAFKKVTGKSPSDYSAKMGM